MEKANIPGFEKAKEQVAITSDQNIAREKGVGWGIYNSGLLKDRDKSGIGDYSFNNVFSGLYPEKYKNIKEYIETELKDVTHRRGLEIGGSGSHLFSEFKRGFFEETKAVTIMEGRNLIRQGRDWFNGHSVVLANALLSSGFRKIKKELGGKKVNLILEKMHGAISNMPDDPSYLGSMLNLYYGLLDEKGIMLLQTPGIVGSAGNQLTLRNALVVLGTIPGLSVDFKTQKDAINKEIFYIRIQRDEKAPKDLRPYF